MQLQLTDAQVLTWAVAVIVPVSALIYSNSRVSDVGKRVDDSKETLRAEMQAMESRIKAEIKELHSGIKAAIERMDNAVKIHELTHHK